MSESYPALPPYPYPPNRFNHGVGVRFVHGRVRRPFMATAWVRGMFRIVGEFETAKAAQVERKRFLARYGLRRASPTPKEWRK